MIARLGLRRLLVVGWLAKGRLGGLLWGKKTFGAAEYNRNIIYSSGFIFYFRIYYRGELFISDYCVKSIIRHISVYVCIGEFNYHIFSLK